MLPLVIALLTPTAAHADSREVTARVEEQWRLAGAHATTLPAKFLFDDETAVVSIPVEAVTTEDGSRDVGCTHIAIIGPRGLSFRAKLSDAPNDPLAPPEPAARASSTAGVLELRRCDPQKPVRHVVVWSDAGRGAIEVVVAHTRGALPPLGSVIPERTGGALPPTPEAGALPATAPVDKRAELAEGRARRDGAVLHKRETTHAGDDGGGDVELDVEEGCHRIEAFGREAISTRSGRRFRLDLDAQLRDGEALLAQDRTEAPDVRVEACVGAPTSLSLAFKGSPPRADVLITRGTWPLPARLPAMWGPTARSKMARAMFVRHIAVPADDPVFLAQGVSGATPVPLPVEAGGCYVAVAGITRGHPKQFQLRATVGGRESTDERGAADEAALSAFCVRAHESARVEIMARGTAVGWGLALFRVRSGAWENGR